MLLYNFFADSTVDLSQWRVVLNGLPEGSSEAQRAPRFDDSRHNGVCREVPSPQRIVQLYMLTIGLA